MEQFLMQNDRILTGRLLLRRHAPGDFDRLWSYLTDPETKRYTGGVTRLSRDERKTIFERDCALPFAGGEAEFAVVSRAEQTYLGYCGVRSSSELGGAELFYGFCRDSWHKGYGLESAAAVVKYAFETLGHSRLYASCEMENTASLSILRRLGFAQLPADTTLTCDAPLRFLLERS
jgi:RimJ/RimL family protein N-acetyltransferase